MWKSILILIMGFSLSAGAHEGHLHARHNMVLFGEGEIFASHIVYKVPHNYQVILQLTLEPADREKYLAAKHDHPSQQFIYLLDTMEIKDIATEKSISGTVFYEDANGDKQTVIASLKINSEDFKVIFFDELPLSLEKNN